jgi:hypothetical protein
MTYHEETREKRKGEQFEEEEVNQETDRVGLFGRPEFRIGDIPERGFVDRSFDKILLGRNPMIESRATCHRNSEDNILVAVL